MRIHTTPLQPIKTEISLVLLCAVENAQESFNPRLRDSPKVDLVAPLRGGNTFVAPNAKVGLQADAHN
jgi:hypothetical protein